MAGPDLYADGGARLSALGRRTYRRGNVFLRSRAARAQARCLACSATPEPFDGGADAAPLATKVEPCLSHEHDPSYRWLSLRPCPVRGGCSSPVDGVGMQLLDLRQDR